MRKRTVARRRWGRQTFGANLLQESRSKPSTLLYQLAFGIAPAYRVPSTYHMYSIVNPICSRPSPKDL